MGMTLSISEVAAASGVRPSALRYYEEAGLITPVGRRGGRRHYQPDVLTRLAFIALCQDVGFTIAEIATLLSARSDARQHWQVLAERKLEDIELRMQKLRQMQRHLQSALACDCGSVQTCELVDSAAERRRLTPHAGTAR
jgi:MerR family transcriptional regulator, redox-sensitive transcriptional activator SoxR